MISVEYKTDLGPIGVKEQGNLPLSKHNLLRRTCQQIFYKMANKRSEGDQVLSAMTSDAVLIAPPFSNPQLLFFFYKTMMSLWKKKQHTKILSVSKLAQVQVNIQLKLKEKIMSTKMAFQKEII